MTRTMRDIALGTAVIVISGATLYAQPQLPPPPPPPATMRAVPVPGPKPVAPVVSQPAVQAAPSLPVAPPLTPPTNAGGAKIQFSSTVHDFGKVKSGDSVKFTYMFTNVGNQVLELTGVQPQCGCTAAGEWTKKVEPGKTGEVPLQFNTASYNGQVLKTITVSCNDAMQPHVLLQVKGTIWKPIEFTPPYTVMNILPDMTNATATVKIVNNMEQPLDIMSPTCALKGFSVELRTNQPGKEFQLIVTAVPPLTPGTISGKVTVQTSATNTPTLDIPFWANVQAAIVVLPPQVMLAAGPLTAKASPSVTIQNNTTNVLTISDPQVSEAGVEAQVRELQPGRIFSIQLGFPEGFQLKPGQQAALTLKTSNSQLPELRIPIVQMATLLTPAPGAPAAQPFQTKVQPATRVSPQGKVPVSRPPLETQ